MASKFKPQLSLHLINLAPEGHTAGWGHLLALARACDAAGIDRVNVSDHVVFGEALEEYAKPEVGGREGGKQPTGPDGHWLEPLTTLAVIAGQTTRVRLGTQILLAALRRPVILAKSAATLDVLSGGRLDLGVGVGWQKEEFDALGVPWERRGVRTDEYLEVLRTLWCDDTSSFDGETFHLPECKMFPKPVQVPHPPIHIGGETEAALRRTARTAQGWHTFNRSPEELASGLRRLDELLDVAGRSRQDVRITVCPYFQALTPETVEQYAEAGADAVAALFFSFSAADVAQTFDGLEACREAAARTEA